MQHPVTSSFLLKIFRAFCDPELHPYIEGDLIEQYLVQEEKSGRFRAKMKLFVEIIFLFRPGIIRSLGGSYRLNYWGMIKNYFVVAIRNMLRHKVYAFINVFGLSIGLASAILIAIYIHYEYSYDRHHAKYDRIYRVLHGFRDSDIELTASDYQVWGCAPIAPVLDDEFAQVEDVFRFTSPSKFLLKYENVSFLEENLVFADPTAFDVFTWPLQQGDPATALTEPYTIVLTDALAKKYFGEEEAVGKNLTVVFDDPITLKVTGVMEPQPTSSHFSHDALISMVTFKNWRPQIFESWGYVDFYTYFTLAEGADISLIEEQIPEVLKKYLDEGSTYQVAFESLEDAYLHSKANRQPGTTGSMDNMLIFLTVAIFMIFIASINYINIATARSAERAKEVAIRKTIGAHRTALIGQFLVEAVLITFVSAVIGVVLSAVLEPKLQLLADKPLTLALFDYWQFWVILIGLALTIGLVSGSYSAIVLSRMQPSQALKGNFSTSGGGVLLRKGLVVFQLCLSMILLVGTGMVHRQMNFVAGHDLGYDQEQMLVIDFGWDGKVQRHLPMFKEAFMRVSGVEAVAVSRSVPGRFFPNAGTQIEDPAGDWVEKAPCLYEIDEDFIPTYGMEMAAGRNYSMDYPTDSLEALVINEASARLFGYPDPKEIIGKKFQQWGREGKVIGVVKDFNYVSLHNDIEPLALRYGTPPNTSMFSLRITGADLQQTIYKIEEVWNELVPYRPFNASFVDQHFQQQYDQDNRFGMIFQVFAGITLVVACLGLLGLTIYSTTQRAKEIGVRKVMGASVVELVVLLSKDVMTLYIIAYLIALPVAWVAMSKWLQGFAYQAPLSVGVFAIAGLVTFVIVMLSVGIKTWLTASQNPVLSLRDE